jgi:hypothetical protein
VQRTSHLRSSEPSGAGLRRTFNSFDSAAEMYTARQKKTVRESEREREAEREGERAEREGSSPL